MRCLSLTQPWATLVAIGAKKIETRSWATPYRGQLAIHASKGFPKWAQEICYTQPFLRHLLAIHAEIDKLPRGAVIATCLLVACKEIKDAVYFEKLGYTPQWATAQPPEPELSFGDYSPGRYAWILDDVQMLPEPIPAKGSLGLWEWSEVAA